MTWSYQAKTHPRIHPGSIQSDIAPDRLLRRAHSLTLVLLLPLIRGGRCLRILARRRPQHPRRLAQIPLRLIRLGFGLCLALPARKAHLTAIAPTPKLAEYLLASTLSR